MKKILFTFVILLCWSTAFSMDYQSLIDKTNYTAGEKDQITGVFKKTEQAGLSVDLLANKVKEAGSKRVRFEALFRVMEQRLSDMREANEVLTVKKMPVKSKQYALRVLTELQEKGIKRQTYERIMDAAVSKGKGFDDTAEYFDVLGKYNDESIPVEQYSDIITACIGKGISPNKSEKLLYMFTEAKRNNMPLNAAKELIMNGISQNKRIEEINDDLDRDGFKKSSVTHNGERQRNEEVERTRGSSRDESLGQTETGGNDTRGRR